MKKAVKQKIEDQYYFSGVSPRQRLINTIKLAVIRSARTSKGGSRALLQMVLGHFAAHVNKRGRLPKYIKMKKHHWEILRKASKACGIVTNKAAEGCSVMGVRVEFT